MIHMCTLLQVLGHALPSLLFLHTPPFDSDGLKARTIANHFKLQTSNTKTTLPIYIYISQLLVLDLLSYIVPIMMFISHLTIPFLSIFSNSIPHIIAAKVSASFALCLSHSLHHLPFLVASLLIFFRKSSLRGLSVCLRLFLFYFFF